MFSPTQPGRRQPIDRPPARTPTPTSPAIPADARKPKAAGAPDDWPPAVHPPEENEDDEC